MGLRPPPLRAASAGLAGGARGLRGGRGRGGGAAAPGHDGRDAGESLPPRPPPCPPHTHTRSPPHLYCSVSSLSIIPFVLPCRSQPLTGWCQRATPQWNLKIPCPSACGTRGSAPSPFARYRDPTGHEQEAHSTTAQLRLFADHLRCLRYRAAQHFTFPSFRCCPLNRNPLARTHTSTAATRQRHVGPGPSLPPRQSAAHTSTPASSLVVNYAARRGEARNSCSNAAGAAGAAGDGGESAPGPLQDPSAQHIAGQWEAFQPPCRSGLLQSKPALGRVWEDDTRRAMPLAAAPGRPTRGIAACSCWKASAVLVDTRGDCCLADAALQCAAQLPAWLRVLCAETFGAARRRAVRGGEARNAPFPLPFSPRVLCARLAAHTHSSFIECSMLEGILISENGALSTIEAPFAPSG